MTVFMWSLASLAFADALVSENLMKLSSGLLEGTSLDDRVASISQLVTGMEGMNDANWSNGNEGKTLLQQLDKSLHEDFAGFLNTTHSEALEEWEREKAKHEACGTQKNFRLTKDVQTAKEAAETQEEIHKLCRTSEMSWTTYNSHKTSTAKLHRVTKEDAEMCKSIATVDQNRKAYKHKAGQLQQCDKEQTSFEDLTCTWFSAKCGTCEGYDACVQTIDLSTTKTRLEAEAVNRQRLWATIAIIRCRIAHLIETYDAEVSNYTNDQPSTFTKRDPCGDADNVDLQWKKNADHLQISLTVPTDGHNVKCSDHAELKILPSKTDVAGCSEWFNKKYDWVTATIPQECEATCPSCDYSKATRDPHCLDNHGKVSKDGQGCSFYEHHPNACGLYDDDNFVSAELCCACGKAPAKLAKGVDIEVGASLASPNGATTLHLQGDGNLVLYCHPDGDAHSNNAVWATHTHNHGADTTKLSWGSDGQLQLLCGQEACWSDGTSENDGELVIVDDGSMGRQRLDGTWAWKSGTSCGDSTISMNDQVLAEKGASGCPAGYQYITDVNRCLSRGQQLGGKDCTSYQGGKHGASGLLGCVFNHNNKCLHFNTENLVTPISPLTISGGDNTVYACEKAPR